MENKNTSNENEREATYIELVWDNKQDLIDLESNETFSNFVLLKSYVAIENAIENNLDKVELFNIFNMSIIIELDKSNFNEVLNKILEYYIGIEDYEECEKIKKLTNR
jgi:hypothetical protein